MCSCRSLLYAGVVTIAVVALLIAAFGVPLRIVLEHALHAGIREATLLTETAPNSTWNRMIRNDQPNDPPDLLNIYIWNVTNLDDVRAGARPVLDEVGPYIFQKWRVKEDVKFNRQGHVWFQEFSYFTWDQERQEDAANGSEGNGSVSSSTSSRALNPLTDKVVTLNLPLLGVLAALDRSATWIRYAAYPAIKAFLQNDVNNTVSGLFMRRTVQELVFGYEDELLLEVAQWVPSLRDKAFFKLVVNMSSPQVAIDMPRNVFDTGVHDPGWAPKWEYLQWQGLDAVTCWAPGHSESVVGGSDALQFPPGLKDEDSVHVFVPELFRNAKLNVTAHIDVHGVRLLMFEPDDKLAAPDPTYFIEISGLMNITACTAVGADGDAATAAGPEVLMSLPHFCYVDPRVAEQTVGTSCDLERHNLWLGVEPHTGITMAAAKRLQVAGHFTGRYKEFDPELRDTILPIFWAEEITSIAPDQAASFRSSVYTVVRLISLLSHALVYVISTVVAALGFLAIAVISVSAARHRGSRLAASGTASRSGGNGRAGAANGAGPAIAAFAAGNMSSRQSSGLSEAAAPGSSGASGNRGPEDGAEAGPVSRRLADSAYVSTEVGGEDVDGVEEPLLPPEGAHRAGSASPEPGSEQGPEGSRRQGGWRGFWGREGSGRSTPAGTESRRGQSQEGDDVGGAATSVV